MKTLALARMYIDQSRWARSVDKPGITDRDKLVLLELVDHADRATGYCYRSLAQIAEGLGKNPVMYSLSSISKSLARLAREDIGLIDKTQRGQGNVNFYSINWPGYDDLTPYEREE